MLETDEVDKWAGIPRVLAREIAAACVVLMEIASLVFLYCVAFPAIRNRYRAFGAALPNVTADFHAYRIALLSALLTLVVAAAAFATKRREARLTVLLGAIFTGGVAINLSITALLPAVWTILHTH